jgi:hypothetical protein
MHLKHRSMGRPAACVLSTAVESTDCTLQAVAACWAPVAPASSWVQLLSRVVGCFALQGVYSCLGQYLSC